MAACAAVGAFSMIATGILWLTGTWSAPINARIDVFSRQMDEFRQRLELLPRADQLAAVEGHAHALDGRMDALESRLRGDELDIARAIQRLQGIEDSSRVGLGARR